MTTLPRARRHLARALMVLGGLGLSSGSQGAPVAAATLPAASDTPPPAQMTASVTAATEPLGLQVQTSAPWTVLAVQGLAARAGLHVGDHVLAVNGQAFSRAEQLPIGLSRASPSAALLVERDGREIFIPLHWP